MVGHQHLVQTLEILCDLAFLSWSFALCALLFESWPWKLPSDTWKTLQGWMRPTRPCVMLWNRMVQSWRISRKWFLDLQSVSPDVRAVCLGVMGMRWYQICTTSMGPPLGTQTPPKKNANPKIPKYKWQESKSNNANQKIKTKNKNPNLENQKTKVKIPSLSLKA